DPELGLARLVANPPWLSSNPDPPSEGCEDCLNCYGMDGLPLCVVRQWRTCGNTSLLSVTIRPARTSDPGQLGLHPTSAGTAGALSSEQHRMLQADKLATVGQLAAGMAHEINNPICYVQSNMGTFRDYVNKLFGLLELSDDLLRDTRMTAEERVRAMETRKHAVDFPMIVEDLPSLLEESREGVDRIRKIVQNLRDFSRSDSTEAFQLFDVHRALTTALELVRSLSGKHLGFVTHFDALPLIECNPTELGQVFMNILVNATQAVGADGRIGITTRKLDANRVQIDISDNGCGIDEHVLGHIFEPFFTTKDVGSGTGLGLSITFGIVKKHGGEIAVRSAVGKGSLFQITLPVKQPVPVIAIPA
ncbi:MAG TPA: ATP-binding protein, partial [Rhodanobacteraceae bacterium]|nr:ATP-binding protein [Rhodanobacteraceae bacterium]